MVICFSVLMFSLSSRKLQSGFRELRLGERWDATSCFALQRRGAGRCLGSCGASGYKHVLRGNLAVRLIASPAAAVSSCKR